MSGTNQEDGVLEDDAALAAAGDGEDGGGQQAPEGGDPHGEDAESAEARRSRPGRIERRLQRTERELDDARREAAAARLALEQMQRQLHEAHDAGNRLAQHSLQQQIRGAQEELRQAHVSNDTDAFVAAQTKLASLAAVAAQQPRQAASVPQQPQPAQQPRYTPSTAAWMQANPWYGTNAKLTALARAVHEQAVEQNLAVDTEAYWSFVNRGINAVAPGTVRAARDPDDDDDGAQATPAAPAARSPAVASQNRAPAKAPPNPRASSEVRLSADEAEAARVCGMSPQEYKQWQTKLRQAGRLGKGS